MFDATKTHVSKLQQLFCQHNAFIRLPYQQQKHVVNVSVRQDVSLADLQGIERQKAAAQANLERFMQGLSYNHMLLWGARGTGKSSLVRALFLHYQRQEPQAKLKILQLACDDLDDLAFLMWIIAQTDAKFMIYIDDLSFTAQDGSYRALKAVLDGSIAGIPDNVLMCVTSNRRHLMPEYHQDDNAIHPEEDVEENISLSERFGLCLSFHPLSQAQYLDTLRYLLAARQIAFNETIKRQALQYALARGSRSARVAAQFVKQFNQSLSPSKERADD